jgi:TetR/AcrR family transcriptional regulator
MYFHPTRFCGTPGPLRDTRPRSSYAGCQHGHLAKASAKSLMKLDAESSRRAKTKALTERTVQATTIARASTKTKADQKQSRNPLRSKRSILNAAHREFCQHGYSGGRVEAIAKRSKVNLRMIYHYFGDKEGLYLAVLETAYLRLRTLESQLNFGHASPVEAMRQLIRLTYDFLACNPDVLAIISNENTLRGRFLKKLPSVKARTLPLIESIADVLRRGHAQGLFRRGVDPLQFYISLVALSQLHIVNRFTLSIIFDKDLADETWLQERRICVEHILMSYLQDVQRGASIEPRAKKLH